MPRRSQQIDRVEFTADVLTDVVACMTRLADAGDGWINLLPKIGDDFEGPTTLRFLTLLGAGASGVTMCTWIPASQDRRGDNQVSLGITHVTGRRAVPQLNVPATSIPETWVVEQDHPRRGLVLRVPAGEPHEQVLGWALRAVGSLSEPRDIRRWRADIHNPAAA
jgi:hypothetical protein